MGNPKQEPQEIDRVRKEAAAIFHMFQEISWNGAVCSIPDTGLDTMTHRTWCAQCRDLWKRLRALSEPAAAPAAPAPQLRDDVDCDVCLPWEHYESPDCKRRQAVEIDAPAPPQSDELRSALEPFASIGAWLFARPEVPDDEVMVQIYGINGSRGAFTRGQFKAAYRAFAAAPAPPPQAEPPRCDCGDALTQCSSCAVADWQAAHPECHVCCPVRPVSPSESEANDGRR